MRHGVLCLHVVRLQVPPPYPAGAPSPYMGMPHAPGGPYMHRPMGHGPPLPGAAAAGPQPPLPNHPPPPAAAAAAPAVAASPTAAAAAGPPVTAQELEQQQLEAEAAAIEAEAAQAEADATRRAAEEAKAARLKARAWTAHKAADGQMYYHNTLTGESSWTTPEGFEGEAPDVADTPVPVAQANVTGTDWYEVKCADGRRYYFNHATQETAWSMPPEVAAVKKKQAEEAAAAADKARQAAAEQRAKAQQQLQQAAVAAAAGSGSSSAAGGGLPGGPPRPGFMPGFNGPPPPGFWGNADAFRRMHMQRMMGARAAQQAAAGGPAGLSKEARVQRFKQLLLEGGVNAFSFYAKVGGWLLVAGGGCAALLRLTCSCTAYLFCVPQNPLHCSMVKVT